MRAPCQAYRARSPGEPVLSLEVRERLGGRHGAGPRERPDRGSERLRVAGLVEVVRLAERSAEQRVVVPADEVQRLPHHRCLHDRPAREQALERLAPETHRARPDPDVGRRRPLRLHPDEALDRRRR